MINILLFRLLSLCFVNIRAITGVFVIDKLTLIEFPSNSTKFMAFRHIIGNLGAVEERSPQVPYMPLVALLRC